MKFRNWLICFFCLQTITIHLQAAVEKKTQTRSNLMMSPDLFFKQLNQIDPNFKMPDEPLINPQKSYFRHLSKLIKSVPRPMPLKDLMQSQDMNLKLASPELKLVKAKYLEQVSKIVSSPHAKCGYNPDEDFLGQVGNSIIGMNDFDKVLRSEILSAITQDQKDIFLRRQKQYLNYLQKTMECSYAVVQFFIANGQTTTYLKMLNNQAIPQKFKDAAMPDIQKFQAWYASRFDQTFLSAFYPREIFSYFSGLFRTPTALKDFFC